MNILSFSKKENNRCHLISVVLLKDFRDSDAILTLNEGFMKKITKMKERGYFIDDIIIDCVSVDGIKYAIEQFNANLLQILRMVKFITLHAYHKKKIIFLRYHLNFCRKKI